MSDEDLEAGLTVTAVHVSEWDQSLAVVREQAREVALYYKTLRDGQVPATLAGQLTRAWQASAWAEDSGF